jgi:hypothetical protein
MEFNMKNDTQRNISYDRAVAEMKKVIIEEVALNNNIPKSLHCKFKTKAAQEGTTIKNELIRMITSYVES